MPLTFNVNAVTQVPMITTSQRGSIPAATLSTGGCIIYNTDTNRFEFWRNSAWSYPYSPGVPTFLYDDYSSGYNNFFAGTGIAGSISVPTAQQNVGIGPDCLASLTIGNSNTAVGARSLYSVDVSGGNSAFGDNSGQYIVGGGDNSCFGAASGPDVTNINSNFNTFLGARTTTSAVVTNSTAVGWGATIGASNSVILGKGCFVGIGKDAPAYAIHLGTDHSMTPLMYMASTSVPAAPSTANDGIFLVNGGKPTFKSGTLGYNGVLITGQMDSPSSNILINFSNGTLPSSGSDNYAFGVSSGSVIGSGSYNCLYGTFAGKSITTSSGNCLFGLNAGKAISTGSGSNSFFGYNSGQSITTGSTITLLGASTDASATLTNATAIGANASVTASNCLILGSGANIGIGTTAPIYKFQIDGSRTAARTAYITGTHSSNSSTTAGLVIDENITSTGAIGNAMHAWIYPNFNATGGTITSAAGLLIDTGGNSGGTITSGYGLYVVNPSYGTSQCAIFGANASIGYTGVTPPTSGLIVTGDTGIGTSAPASRLHVVKGLSYSIQDYGMVTFDTSTSGGSGISLGYDTTNNWTWIYSRTNGVVGRPLSLNNVLYIGPVGTPSLSLGTSTLTSSTFTCAMPIIPDGNKTRDLGSTSKRWNNAFYSSATTGTSRLAESKTKCAKCDIPMMRGTGTTITLGEEADYIPVFCVKCGDHKVEALKHLPIEALASRKSPEKIEFLGFKVCQYSGNSRGIQVMFKYGDDKENSTFLSDVEYEAFISMDTETRKKYLEELGLREWNALEEVRLMEMECEQLQNNLDSLVKDFVGQDIYNGANVATA